MKYPNHIVFCVNDSYIQYVLVCIRSLFDAINEEDSLNITLLVDAISRRNIKRLRELGKNRSNINIQWIVIDDSTITGLNNRWSIYAWYRLLIPDYLSKDVHRVLYLDADTIVVGDISPLFSIDMDGIAVAGVTDPKNFEPETFERCGYDSYKRYICSGVLVMNLDYWREHNLTDVIIRWARDNNDIIKFPDQDAINVICKDNKIVLPFKYGIINDFYLNEYLDCPSYKDELLDCIDNPVIIHYAGQAPWKREIANHLLQGRWMYYNKKLRHPAKRHYITKGWPFVKMMVWHFLYPPKGAISIEDVRQRLLNSNDS